MASRRTAGTEGTLVERFSAMLGNDVADETIDLIRGSLLIAELEYPALDAVPHVRQIERMALRAAEYLPLDAEPVHYIQVLNRVLYDEQGLRGNREDYYDPRNSFLNDVLDRKLGIPITLAVIYMEVARRIEFPLVGVGMPGHFLLKHYDVDGRETLIDCFERGALVTPADCQRRLDQIYSGQLSLESGFLVAVPRRQILLRMLNNLRSIYLTARNFKKALAIVDLILAVYPRSPEDVKQRGLLRYETGHKRLALDDFDLYLKMSPDASDAGEIRQIALSIRRQLATLN